tara:strand:- start:223 stop:411 length:189 start_codon:yes stop_codon:yes gene_type:complete
MNGIHRTPAQLQQRKDLIADLGYAIKQDNNLLDELLDDLVYRLSQQEVEEYEVLVGSIFGDE